MDKSTNVILTGDQIMQKVRRMAFEIYENNFQEKEIVIAGVCEKGIRLAELLFAELKDISPIKLKLVKIDLDKVNPMSSEISINCDTNTLRNKTIILVDDVLNTGKTFAYSMRPFLNIKVKKIEVAVLVNRNHTQFPISSNYTGYELSTTLNEHVEVVLNKKKKEVYLH